MRGTSRLRELYSFRPYNWGPYSGGLARDLDSLVRENKLTIKPAAESAHGRYETTVFGEEAASAVWQGLVPEEQKFIRAVRTYVTHKSFNHLLREVYAEYPAYATKSRFAG